MRRDCAADCGHDRDPRTQTPLSESGRQRAQDHPNHRQEQLNAPELSQTRAQLPRSRPVITIDLAIDPHAQVRAVVPDVRKWALYRFKINCMLKEILHFLLSFVGAYFQSAVTVIAPVLVSLGEIR